MIHSINDVRRFFRLLAQVGTAFIVLSTLGVAIVLDIRAAGTYVFACTTVTCIVFCLVYARAPWKTTHPGRAIMYVVGSFGLVGLVVCAQIIFGSDWKGIDQVRLGAYLSVAVAVFNVLLTMWLYQIEAKMRRKTAKK